MKKIFTTLTILLFSSILFAQVDLEINDGMLVETTGGLSIEVSGDLIENGSGYLKGVVTTGDRGAGGVSSFAGLNLASGGVDQIIRTTGSPLSSATPKTTLRSYELDNSSSLFTADVTSNLVTSGPNDETNLIDDTFIFTKIGATWKGYTDNGSTESSIAGADVDIPAGTSNIAISEGLGVGAAIFLEGPYAGSSAMSNTINGSIPLASPYSEALRTASSIHANAVDWVLLELRTGTSATTSVGYRSAFVDINGNIIRDDGTIGTGFPAVPNSYYLVVKHRNHLGIMSNSAQSYNWISE